jgi:8-oxo-dGTP pyrophosphatase MutT (NUDIX family)
MGRWRRTGCRFRCGPAGSSGSCRGTRRSIPRDETPHGGEGVCVTADGDIVVISPDGMIWDLPAGRPEPGDSWEQTLRREMDEEACATVVSARLLGLTRGQCVAGPERGRVLVRSVWASRCRAPPVGDALRDRRTPCRRPGRG